MTDSELIALLDALEEPTDELVPAKKARVKWVIGIVREVGTEIRCP